MRKFSICGREFDASVVVFDKDGLLFRSEAFWRELMQARTNAALKRLDLPTVCGWLELMDAVGGFESAGSLALAREFLESQEAELKS